MERIGPDYSQCQRGSPARPGTRVKEATHASSKNPLTKVKSFF